MRLGRGATPVAGPAINYSLTPLTLSLCKTIPVYILPVPVYPHGLYYHCTGAAPAICIVYYTYYIILCINTYYVLFNPGVGTTIVVCGWVLGVASERDISACHEACRKVYFHGNFRKQLSHQNTLFPKEFPEICAQGNAHVDW